MTGVVCAVFGVSACGKSSVAEELAAAHGCVFVDADWSHSSEAKEKMASGEPLTDADREPWLGRVGEAAASGLVQHAGDAPPCVALACSALARHHRERLTREIQMHAARQRAGLSVTVLFVFLNVPEEEIRKRLSERAAGSGGHFFDGSDMAQSQFDALEAPTEDNERYLEIKASAKNAQANSAAKSASLAWEFISSHLQDTGGRTREVL